LAAHLTEINKRELLEAIRKTDSIVVFAKSEMAEGRSALNEAEAARAWTAHAVVHYRVKGESDAQCFAKMIAAEPLAMRHIQHCRNAGWIGAACGISELTKNVAAEDDSGAKARGAADATAVDNPTATLGDTAALIRQTLVINPWMDVAAATKYGRAYAPPLSAQATGATATGRAAPIGSSASRRLPPRVVVRRGRGSESSRESGLSRRLVAGAGRRPRSRAAGH